MNDQKITISALTILKIIAIPLGLWLLWQIRGIVFILFVVLIFVAAFGPTIDKLQEKKVPRIISVIILYLILIAVLTLIGYLVIPPLVLQIKQLGENMPFYVEKLTPTYYSVRNFYQSESPVVDLIQKSLTSFSDQLANFGSQVLLTTAGVVSGLVAVVTVLVLTFYLLLEQRSLRSFFKSLVPLEQQEKVVEILHKIGDRWGAWLRGQLLLSLSVGIIDFIALTILGVPYALTLGIIAAFLEFIPILGPILAAIPAVLIALTVSPWKALIVIIIYIAVQQLENHILVPKIMQRTVGLSPVLIIIGILTGGTLFGIIGIILAVPILAGAMVLIKEWIEYKKTNESQKA